MSSNEDEHFNKWLNFLDPEKLKSKLIAYSLYIAFFESLKEYIIQEVKYFYHQGLIFGKERFDSKYKKDVLSLNKSKLYASLEWLVNLEAISSKDILLFEDLKKYRNKLAHEMMTLLFEDSLKKYHEKLRNLMEFYIKIEHWFISNIELPTDSDVDLNSSKEIIPGSQFIYKIILDIVDGDEKTSKFYYNFLKMKKRK